MTDVAANQDKNVARFLLAFAAGVGAGTLLTPFYLLLSHGLFKLVMEPETLPAFLSAITLNDLLDTLVFLPLFAFVWFLGLLFVGAPIWGFLHDIRLRGPTTALVTGALILGVPFLLFATDGFTGESSSVINSRSWGFVMRLNGHLTEAGWVRAFVSAGMFSVVGACVGWTIWRVAYGSKAKI